MRRRLGVLVVTLATIGVMAPGASAATITSRGLAWHAQWNPGSQSALRLSVPGGSHVGDVIVATLGIGNSGATAQPSVTTPAGWTLASRTNYGTVGTLAVYTHVLAAGESSWTWQTSVNVGGVAFTAAFANVDVNSPVDFAGGQTATRTAAISPPPGTTTIGGEVLYTGYYGFTLNGQSVTWTPPSGMTELGDARTNKGVSTSSVDYALQSAAGPTGLKTASASRSQDYEIASLITLRPASVGIAPTISGVSAGPISSSGATVTWTTDQPADSQVEYGPTSTYGSSTTVDTATVTSHSVSLGGLPAATTYHYRVKSRNAAGLLSTSGDFTFTTQSATGGATPIILDTDIFSDAGDVGALAAAYALQRQGEAQLLAVGVDTRLSRPAVPTTSWKCVAAVARYYGFATTPIGTDLPNNGTDTNTADFTGPCSKLAPAGTPVPGSAVNVYRQALAGQPDGSVVMVGIGYEENLSALLNSPPDSISALDGHDLIARKVKALVLMAGGYPSFAGENNLIGNPGAAQDVAANWPTKVEWSGYEVGDLVHTGQTISSVQPVDSPVRVAYEAFVGPNNWIYSYDLTAIYHAVRPADQLLTEIGPGTNVVDSSGGNVFTLGSGDQYYLKLGDPTSLDAAIEQLLDVVPPDVTPPLITNGNASTSASGATISWTTNEPSTTQVDYGTTSSYGSSTVLDSSLATNHAGLITGLTPGLTYHYRVRSADGAGNLSMSADQTFTIGSGGVAGPLDDFNSNVLDPSKWTVISDGSTVAAANQELEITHVGTAWTKGTLATVPYNQAGRSVQLHVIRPADGAQSNASGFGETSIQLWVDSTHYVELFFGSGSLTAWYDSGASAETNLTPNWPAYSPTAAQWVRFRESGGTLYYEYAAGATSPGSWTTLASIADPIPMGAVSLRIAAGTNVSSTDTAQFDDVSTS